MPAPFSEHILKRSLIRFVQGGGGGVSGVEAAARATSLEPKTAHQGKHSDAAPWLIVSLTEAVARTTHAAQVSSCESDANRKSWLTDRRFVRTTAAHVNIMSAQRLRAAA